MDFIGSTKKKNLLYRKYICNQFLTYDNYICWHRVDKLTTLPIYYKNIKYLDSYYKTNTSGYHILVVEFFIISMRRTSICIEKNLISIFMRVRVFYFQFLSIELEWIATHLLKYTFRSIKCSKRKVSTKHIFSCPFIVRCNIW